MIPVRVRVRIPREDLEEMRGCLTALFAPGSGGRKGESTVISRSASYSKDEMLVGAKILFTWSRHEATAYIYTRRKPGVKASYCSCVGSVSGLEPSSAEELKVVISNPDWDTGKWTQSLMVLEAMDPAGEVSA